MAVSQLQQVRLSVCDRTARLGRERGGREQGRSIQRLSTSRSLASLMPLEQRKKACLWLLRLQGWRAADLRSVQK